MTSFLLWSGAILLALGGLLALLNAPPAFSHLSEGVAYYLERRFSGETDWFRVGQGMMVVGALLLCCGMVSCTQDLATAESSACLAGGGVPVGNGGGITGVVCATVGTPTVTP